MPAPDAVAWEAYDARPGVGERVRDAVAAVGGHVRAGDVVGHYGQHLPVQPRPSRPLRRREDLATLLRAPEQIQDVVRALYRMRVLTAEQIRDAFYAQPGGSPAAAERLRARHLTALASLHCVYRVHPTRAMADARGAPTRTGARSLFFCGRNSVPWLARAEGIAAVPVGAWITHRDQVGALALAHDLRANGLWVALRRHLRDAGGVAAGHALDAQPRHWWGPRQAAFGFSDPVTGAASEVRSDGMCALARPRTDFTGGDPLAASAQLPWIYEYDHASRQARDVAAQLLAYDRLARTDAVGRRFPALAAADYTLPVLMVFSERRRVPLVAWHLRAAVDTHARAGASPIFGCADADWQADPLLCPVVSMWAPDAPPRPWLHVLLDASAPLIRAGTTAAELELECDLTAARPPRVAPEPRAGDRRAQATADAEHYAALARRVVARDERA